MKTYLTKSVSELTSNNVINPCCKFLLALNNNNNNNDDDIKV